MKNIEIIVIAIALSIVMVAIAVSRLTIAVAQVQAENKCIAEHIAAGQPRADIQECTL